MVSISASLRAGITGATITLVGMPAAASVSMVASRFSGVAARGSIARASLRSSVVTEIATLTRPRSAIRPRMSMSRSTIADLVTMPTGWLVRSSTSRISRVIRYSRSIGW